MPPITSIDGIRLDGFQLGGEYEVGNNIGALFLAEGWAEPVALDAPKPPEPFTEDDPYDSRALYQKPPPTTGDTQRLPIEQAADRRRKRRFWS
jgi:hypothetical protein